MNNSLVQAFTCFGLPSFHEFLPDRCFVLSIIYLSPKITFSLRLLPSFLSTLAPKPVSDRPFSRYHALWQQTRSQGTHATM